MPSFSFLFQYPCSNITLKISDHNSSDVETLIDQLSEQVGWAYKTYQQKNTPTVFNYQSSELGTFSLSGIAIITFTITEENKDSILSIDSVLKGNTRYGPLFDIWNKNDEIIDLCVGKLAEKYGDEITVLKQNEIHTHRKPLISNIYTVAELAGILLALAYIVEFALFSK